jgi:hypothetical protein
MMIEMSIVRFMSVFMPETGPWVKRAAGLLALCVAAHAEPPFTH